MNLQKKMEDIVNDSLSKVEDTIIEGLRAEKFEASAKSFLESTIYKLKTDCDKQDQYNRRKI